MEGFYDVLEIKVFGRIYKILDDYYHERMQYDDDLKNYDIGSRFHKINVWHPRSNDDKNNRLLVEIDGTKFDVKLYDMFDASPPEVDKKHKTSKNQKPKSADSDSDSDSDSYHSDPEVYSDYEKNHYPQFRESPENNGIKFKYRRRRIYID